MELDKLIATHRAGLGGGQRRCLGHPDEPWKTEPSSTTSMWRRTTWAVSSANRGRIAKAIRTVLRAAANRAEEKVAVEID